MTRHLVIFIVTFALGAVIAVILRTGNHKPYEDHTGHPAPSAASAAPATAYDAHAAHQADAAPGEHKEHQESSMAAPGKTPDADMSTVPTPAHEHQGHMDAAAPAVAPMTPAAGHEGHDHHDASAADEAPATVAVNTLCAICGMPVDPKLGTIPYKGKPIGFGCKTCPAKFQADPMKYGEAALKNQVAE